MKTGKFFFLSILLFSGCQSLRKEKEVIRIDPSLFKKQKPLKIEETAQNYVYYTAKENETLMLVAFRMYGDYRKWKAIQRENIDLLKNGEIVPAGAKLKIPKPVNPYSPPAEGNPYLVKEGENLGEISYKIYGTMKLWPILFEYNKKQIPYPNLIFHGFTIFYPPNPNQNQKL